MDLKKSRKEQEVFLAKEKAAKERRASVVLFNQGRSVENVPGGKEVPKDKKMDVSDEGLRMGSSTSLEREQAKS